MSNLHGFDIAVIAAYFLVLAGIGYWAARREKNVSADFFLASRDVGWFAVGASLFASNIGSEHLVGLAGTGAASGLAVGHFEWLACFMLLLLGWLFVPFYLRSGVYTMPEFLERRFNPAARSYFTWVSIIGYVLTKISVTLFAGGIVMREVTGYSVWTSAVILIVVTGIYTVLGGLRAVIYTEVMQAVVLIIGSATMTVLGLQAVGGWSGLEARVPADFFSMWKPMNHPNFPWTGIVFGAPILGVWYWCTDQHIVQRVLAAKNVSAARTGTIFAGFLKILPVFIFVLPGIIAAALYADIRGGSADAAYPALVTRLLPAGSAAGGGGTDHHRAAGRVGSLVDSVYEVHLAADLHLSAECAGVHRTADRGLLPAWCAVPEAEWDRRAGGTVDRPGAGDGPPGARARAGQSGQRLGVVLVRHDQLPALRGIAVCAVLGDPHRGQPRDRAARDCPDGRADGRGPGDHGDPRSIRPAHPQCRPLDCPGGDDRGAVDRV